MDTAHSRRAGDDCLLPVCCVSCAAFQTAAFCLTWPYIMSNRCARASRPFIATAPQTKHTMRTVLSSLLLILATALGAYSLVLSHADVPENTLWAYQSVVKIIMFYASFAVIGAEASLILARSWLRLAAIVPFTLAALAFWEVSRIWNLAFPG